jgi:hypothetical protein
MKLKHFLSYTNNIRKIYQSAWARTLAYGDNKYYIQHEKESLKNAYVELEKEENFLKILTSKTISEQTISQLVNLKLKDLPRKETGLLFDQLIKENQYLYIEKLLENYPDVLYINMTRILMHGLKEEQVPAFTFLINLREKIDDVDYVQFSIQLIKNQAPKELIELSIQYLSEKNVDNNEVKYDPNFLVEMRQEINIKLNGQWDSIPKRNSVNDFFKDLKELSESSGTMKLYTEKIRTEIIDKVLATNEKNYLEEKIARFRNSSTNSENEIKKSKKI